MLCSPTRLGNALHSFPLRESRGILLGNFLLRSPLTNRSDINSFRISPLLGLGILFMLSILVRISSWDFIWENVGKTNFAETSLH